MERTFRPAAGLLPALATVVALVALPAPAGAEAPDPPSCTTPPPFDVPLPEPESTIGATIPFFPSCTGAFDTVHIDAPPSHGTLAGADLLGAEYYFDGSYRGPDAFSYHVEGPGGESNVVTQQLNVPNTPPNCIELEDGQITVREGTTAQVRASCFDSNGDAITYTLVGAPRRGSIDGVSVGDVIADLPRLVYRAPIGFSGEDFFAVKADDGFGGIGGAPVYVYIAPDLPPTCAGDVAIEAVAGRSVAYDPGPGCSDPESDGLAPVLGAAPGHGLAAVGWDGRLHYTAPAGYRGADAFTFTMDDGHGGQSDTVRASVAVTGPNRAPACADLGPLAVGHDSARGIALSCTDPDPGTMLTYNAVTGPAHGTLAGSSSQLTYTPDAGYSGPDSFTYRARDGQAKSPPARVALTVAHARSLPVTRSRIRHRLAGDVRALGHALRRVTAGRLGRHGATATVHWLRTGRIRLAIRMHLRGGTMTLVRGTRSRHGAGHARVHLRAGRHGRRVLTSTRRRRVLVVAAFRAGAGTTVTRRLHVTLRGRCAAHRRASWSPGVIGSAPTTRRRCGSGSAGASLST
jgi:hypothetical protein